MKTGKIKLSEVVLDFNVYPRADVDSQHVGYLREAEDSGAELPPIVVDSKSKRVVDGFHRVRMWQHKYKEEPNKTVPCIFKTYPDESALLLDAIRYNASHGRTLTRYDRTHCILLADDLRIAAEDLAMALSMTVEKIGLLKTERVGTLQTGKTSRPMALKRTIRHMSGRTMSKHQREINDRLGGMNQSFYVNQLIMLIEADLLDWADEQLIKRLSILFNVLAKIRGRLKRKETA
jgi:hypothetical protein